MGVGRTGKVDAQGRVHDHDDPEYTGRVGCRACDERLQAMGVPVIRSELTSLVTSRWRVHDWVRTPASTMPGDPPHFYDPDLQRRQVGVVWADRTHTLPLAVRDDDGCQALIERRVSIDD